MSRNGPDLNPCIDPSLTTLSPDPIWIWLPKFGPNPNLDTNPGPNLDVLNHVLVWTLILVPTKTRLGCIILDSNSKPRSLESGARWIPGHPEPSSSMNSKRSRLGLNPIPEHFGCDPNLNLRQCLTLRLESTFKFFLFFILL